MSRRPQKRYPFKNAVCHAHVGGVPQQWHRILVERCIRRDGHPLPHRSRVYEWTTDSDHHRRDRRGMRSLSEGGSR